MNLENWPQLEALLESWPPAVDKSLICSFEETDLTERANAIVAYFLDDIKDKSFLDFGCGMGHVVKQAKLSGAKTAIGYDVTHNNIWDDNCYSSLQSVKEYGPYDVILVYDVLDHADDPLNCLKAIKELTHNESVVYLLTHPWCSRHAGHLYHTFNYAFAHLIFSKEELSLLGHDINEFQKIVRPIIKYKKWISDTGFKIKSHEIIRDIVEPFFKDNPKIKSALMKNIQSLDADLKEFPEFQLEQSFHEFILTV